MTYPLQPIGNRPTDTPTVAPVDRTSGAERRRERHPDDERERKRGSHDDGPETPSGPDADGHIDIRV